MKTNSAKLAAVVLATCLLGCDSESRVSKQGTSNSTIAATKPAELKLTRLDGAPSLTEEMLQEFEAKHHRKLPEQWGHSECRSARGLRWSRNHWSCRRFGHSSRELRVCSGSAALRNRVRMAASTRMRSAKRKH